MQPNEQLELFQQQSQQKPLSRRDFLRVLTIAGTAGAGCAAAAFAGINLTRHQRSDVAALVTDGLKKLPKRKLGTRLGGMMVTPICISSDWNPELLASALDVGINFIHKAGYWRRMPDEVKPLPRDSYYTDITVDSTPNNPDDFDRAYNQVATALDRTGLRYFDIMRAHFGWHSVDAFKNQTGTYRAFQKLKREGKVRYFGVSQHANLYDNPYPSYPEIIQAEIDSGLIDSMQVWFSYGFPKEVEEVFAKASKAGIGMTAMKTFAYGGGKMRNDPARMAELKADGMAGRACIRHVLTTHRPDGKPIFQTCVSAIGNMQVFEENVGGASQSVALRDGFTLSA